MRAVNLQVGRISFWQRREGGERGEGSTGAVPYGV